MTPETGTGVGQPQAKDCRTLPKTTGSWEEARSPLQVSEGAGPSAHLDSRCAASCALRECDGFEPPGARSSAAAAPVLAHGRNS